MTDRIVSLTVVLEKEVREDDCQAIIDAVKMIKGVGHVTAEVGDVEFYTARAQATIELWKRISELFEEYL